MKAILAILLCVAAVSFSALAQSTNVDTVTLDWNPSPSSGGIGSDLSARFTDDYGRATRSVPWDAGAWEYVGRTATARTASVGTATEN